MSSLNNNYDWLTKAFDCPFCDGEEKVWNNLPCSCISKKQHIIDRTKDYILREIIGNDTVPYTSDTPSYKKEQIYKTKNKFRAEQRKKLQDSTGGSNE